MAVKKQNISAQNTVKRIYEANDCLSILKFISKLGGFGFRLEYDIQEKKLVFCCVPVSDRSSTVIFGDKFNNISETDIYEETSDYKMWHIFIPSQRKRRKKATQLTVKQMQKDCFAESTWRKAVSLKIYWKD